MKKRIAAMCATVAIAALAVGGTLAYFTDTDSAKNVMTTGGVDIVQNEQERGDNGKLIEWTDEGKKLVPYTGAVDPNGMATEYGAKATIDGTTYDMFDQDKNAIDKIVTVTNENDSEACYVRTLFAFEMIPAEKDAEGKVTSWKSPLTNGSLGNGRYIYTTAAKDARGLAMAYCEAASGQRFVIDVDGVQYCIYEYYYDGILKPGDTTAPSLRSLYLSAKAGNEWADLIGEDGKYNVLVLSQAVQVDGFQTEAGVYKVDDALKALNTAFGSLDCDYVAKYGNAVDANVVAGWFADVK